MASPDAVLVLSPAAARLALLPEGVPCLAQGEATARALRALPSGREVRVSASPRAEGPVRPAEGPASPGADASCWPGPNAAREHLEQAAEGTPWRLLPWITHREGPVEPAPPMPELEAVLALSPLQAELLGPRSGAMNAPGLGRTDPAGFPPSQGILWMAGASPKPPPCGGCSSNL